MSACTFFGHRDCHSLDRSALYSAIEAQICQGVDMFYVGNQGQFDRMVYSCLKELQVLYPHIRVAVVLAYLPSANTKCADMTDTMYPEIEGPPKFAIDRRNRWMIGASERCLCYIDHPWGGAYKYTTLAKKQGKQIVNIGSVKL